MITWYVIICCTFNLCLQKYYLSQNVSNMVIAFHHLFHTPIKTNISAQTHNKSKVWEVMEQCLNYLPCLSLCSLFVCFGCDFEVLLVFSFPDPIQSKEERDRNTYFPDQRNHGPLSLDIHYVCVPNGDYILIMVHTVCIIQLNLD